MAKFVPVTSQRIVSVTQVGSALEVVVDGVNDAEDDTNGDEERLPHADPGGHGYLHHLRG